MDIFETIVRALFGEKFVHFILWILAGFASVYLLRWITPKAEILKSSQFTEKFPNLIIAIRIHQVLGAVWFISWLIPFFIAQRAGLSPSFLGMLIGSYALCEGLFTGITGIVSHSTRRHFKYAYDGSVQAKRMGYLQCVVSLILIVAGIIATIL